LFSKIPLFSHYCIFNWQDGIVMDSDIMTMKELAEYLKLNEKTAYRLTSDGKIPAFKVGGSWRFRKTEIDSWISSQEKETQKSREE
jgi:excisionase family DNA binding protein